MGYVNLIEFVAQSASYEFRPLYFIFNNEEAHNPTNYANSRRHEDKVLA